MKRIFRVAILSLAVAAAPSFAGMALAQSEIVTAAPSKIGKAATAPAKPEKAAKIENKASGESQAADKKSETKTAKADSSSKVEKVAQSGGYVYLLRGLLNIFSLGMDDLAAKLQARGIAAGVYEYGGWESLCNDAAARYRAGKGPIILVGHSLGADAVIYMANRLGQMGIPVALVVAFDPVHPVPLTGGTTASFVNLYQSDNGWGRAVPSGGSFHGSLNNMDLRKHTEMSHTTIDKSAMLHNMVIGRVQAILGGRSKPKNSDAVPASAPSTAPHTPAPSPSASIQSAPETVRPVLAPSASQPSQSQTQ